MVATRAHQVRVGGVRLLLPMTHHAVLPRRAADIRTTHSPPPQAASSGGSASHAGRALLHDFCMTIPYSAIALVSAVIAVVLKAPSAGMQLAGAGAAVALCSVLSLRAWRRGGSAVPFTLASTGASGWVAHAMWQRVAAGVAPVPSGVMLALSAALALFCVYNVLAGGNPPPGHKAQ
jgi:hypothetical protein